MANLGDLAMRKEDDDGGEEEEEQDIHGDRRRREKSGTKGIQRGGRGPRVRHRWPLWESLENLFFVSSSLRSSDSFAWVLELRR